jgi:hypothetical protein
LVTKRSAFRVPLVFATLRRSTANVRGMSPAYSTIA